MPVCLGQKTCLAKKKSQLRAFHLERKRVRRIDLKANSRVFLLWVRAFPTLHWKECKEQMFPSACKHQTPPRSKEKKPVLLERGRNQRCLSCRASCLCACSCSNGFSRPSYVFWVRWEHQTLGYSDMRPGWCLLPPAKLLHSAGGYCFFCESPSNWTGKRLLGLFPKLAPRKVLDIYLHLSGTGQGPLACSATICFPIWGRQVWFGASPVPVALPGSSSIPRHPSLVCIPTPVCRERKNQ